MGDTMWGVDARGEWRPEVLPQPSPDLSGPGGQ